jgi:hypothetical protein
MKSEAELMQSFGRKGVKSGEELIVFKEYCREFVRECENAGFAVLGIEGFFLLQNGHVKPNLDEIADFSDVQAGSWDEYREACSKAADLFIEEMLSRGRCDGYSFTLTDSME